MTEVVPVLVPVRGWARHDLETTKKRLKALEAKVAQEGLILTAPPRTRRRPPRPQQNGKVERSHRIDHEEFWGRQAFATVRDAKQGLAGWERHYNTERFSLALHARTPLERLSDFQMAA